LNWPSCTKTTWMLVLNFCNDFLSTDDLQQGFKERFGRSNAIFMVCITDLLLTVQFMQPYALDTSKADDTVQAYELFTSLLCAGLPDCRVIFCWLK
jgi:hypothetical protein